MSRRRSGLEGTVLGGAPAFDTPFLKLADSVRSWQVGVFAALAVIAILAVSLVHLSVQRQVLVHVVEVDALGRVVYAGEARELSDVEPLIRHELAEFVIDLRTVVADGRALFRNRSRALVHASQPVRAMLARFFREPENDPRLLRQRIWREVQIRSLLPLSETSWQIQWSESDFTRLGGRPAGRRSWTAIVETKLAGGERAVTRDNPLGLYVMSLTWTHLEGAER